MNQKIGQFLAIMLALTAVLLLMATASRAPSATSAPAETTSETTPGATAEPTKARETESLRDALERVEQIITATPLAETALASCVYDDQLNGDLDTEGLGGQAFGYALARLCGQRRMNPISAFWQLEEAGLYQKMPEESGVLAVPAFAVPSREPRSYPYTQEGVRELLTDLLILAGSLEDDLELEVRMLGSNGLVEAEQIFREGEECHYAYFVCYGERTAHFLCFYIRGGEEITDVEFQLLNLRYVSGDAGDLDQRSDRQAAALMTAAELLMTGQSRAGEGNLPFTYGMGDFEAAIERFHFTAGEEQGSLTNYRLRIKE